MRVFFIIHTKTDSLIYPANVTFIRDMLFMSLLSCANFSPGGGGVGYLSLPVGGLFRGIISVILQCKFMKFEFSL